jgi:hypothetical protein
MLEKTRNTISLIIVFSLPSLGAPPLVGVTKLYMVGGVCPHYGHLPHQTRFEEHPIYQTMEAARRYWALSTYEINHISCMESSI